MSKDLKELLALVIIIIAAAFLPEVAESLGLAALL
jgi:hypothetical protein